MGKACVLAILQAIRESHFGFVYALELGRIMLPVRAVAML
jgi:hypothetical protein